MRGSTRNTADHRRPMIDHPNPACGGPPDRPRPPHLCGPPSLYARSFPLIPLWPYDELPMVMQLSSTQPCDLYESATTCCRFANGSTGEPERYVREAIASFLVGCERRRSIGHPCLAADLGANNGWFSAYMLQLGALVVSVEPQQDLAQALRDTVQLNCWSERSVVFNAHACAPGGSQCPGRVHLPDCMRGWRLSYPQNRTGTGYARLHGLPEHIPNVTFEEIFFQTLRPARERAARAATVEFELVKIDVDGMEGEWLAHLESLMRKERLRIRAIVVEGSYLRPTTMHRLQHHHNYSFYRLDALDGRRFIGADGWDVYSPPGTLAPLMRHREDHVLIDGMKQRYSPVGLAKGHRDGNQTRDAFEDEMFGIRGMRHAFRVKANTSLHGWYRLLQPVSFRGYPPMWLLTLDADMLNTAVATVSCDLSVECRKARAADPSNRRVGRDYDHGDRVDREFD